MLILHQCTFHKQYFVHNHWYYNLGYLLVTLQAYVIDLVSMVELFVMDEMKACQLECQTMVHLKADWQAGLWDSQDQKQVDSMEQMMVWMLVVWRVSLKVEYLVVYWDEMKVDEKVQQSDLLMVEKMAVYLVVYQVHQLDALLVVCLVVTQAGDQAEMMAMQWVEYWVVVMDTMMVDETASKQAASLAVNQVKMKAEGMVDSSDVKMVEYLDDMTVVWLVAMMDVLKVSPMVEQKVYKSVVVKVLHSVVVLDQMWADEMDLYSVSSQVESQGTKLVDTMGESSVDLMADVKVVCLV